MTWRIKQVRKARQLTQECVASRMNMSRTHYNGIENGRRHLTLAQLDRLAVALGVRIDELLDMEPAERQLIDHVRAMDAADADALLRYAEAMAMRHKSLAETPSESVPAPRLLRQTGS